MVPRRRQSRQCLDGADRSTTPEPLDQFRWRRCGSAHAATGVMRRTARSIARRDEAQAGAFDFQICSCSRASVRDNAGVRAGFSAASRDLRDVQDTSAAGRLLLLLPDVPRRLLRRAHPTAGVFLVAIPQPSIGSAVRRSVYREVATAAARRLDARPPNTSFRPS